MLEPPPLPPRPVPPTVEDLEGWPVAVLYGTLLVALGLSMLVDVPESVTVLAKLMGWALIIEGFANLRGLQAEGELGWAAKTGGAAFVVTGVAAITWPEITLWSMAVLAGLGLLLVGAFEVMIALVRRPGTGWSHELGIGTLAMTSGVVVLAGPATTVLLLTVVCGTWALTTGSLTLALTLWLHHRVR